MTRGVHPAGWRANQKPKAPGGPKFTVGQRVRVARFLSSEELSNLGLLEAGLPKVKMGELGIVNAVEDDQKVYRNEVQRWSYVVRIDKHPHDSYWNETELEPE